MRETFDVVIVGAGPAGLSAALMLGRCRRRVLVCDSGRPRNAASLALHGYLTRDGVPPRELLAIGRRELANYDTVELRDVSADDAICEPDGGFRVTLEDGAVVRSRKLLIATGVCDNLPAIDVFQDFFGRGFFQCLYCVGW
jgi:thioredoxin reductase